MSSQGEEILVGSLALLAGTWRDKGIACQMATAQAGCRKSTSLVRGTFWEPSELRTFCVRKPRMRLRRCDRWV